MSIEKLCDSSRLEVEQLPYTQISNLVIEKIKDSDAFRLYCYLSSKSRDWEVSKNWTSGICGVGQKKARDCWAYLERCGLLEYVQIRDDLGKFIKHDIRILNGIRFNPDEPFKSTKAKIAPVDNLAKESPTHWGKNPLSGKPTGVGFASQLKKDCEQKKDLKQKREPLSLSDQKINSLPDDIEPLYKNRNAARAKPIPPDFTPNDECIGIARQRGLDLGTVLAKFVAHARAMGWKRTDWHAAFKKWILDEKVIKQSESVGKPAEVRSTVPDYVEHEPVQKASRAVVDSHMDKIRQMLGRKIVSHALA